MSSPAIGAPQCAHPEVMRKKARQKVYGFIPSLLGFGSDTSSRSWSTELLALPMQSIQQEKQPGRPPKTGWLVHQCNPAIKASQGRLENVCVPQSCLIQVF